MSTGEELLKKLNAGYEKMLHRVSDAIDEADVKARPKLEEALSLTREKAVELGELTREEAARISGYIERDIKDAAVFLGETGEDIRNWLRFDIEQVERHLFDSFLSVADKTRVELEGIKNGLTPNLYHTGEMTGPGTLGCSSCGKLIHFTKAGHIPPCSGCRNTEFMRIPDET